MIKTKGNEYSPKDRRRKRPGKHTKSLNKSKKLNYKKYRGQGR
tara:strand:+ start:315 stop:443 length:129 start_codon:yes stop_codon:yes gene_type:complete